MIILRRGSGQLQAKRATTASSSEQKADTRASKTTPVSNYLSSYFRRFPAFSPSITTALLTAQRSKSDIAKVLLVLVLFVDTLILLHLSHDFLQHYRRP